MLKSEYAFMNSLLCG